MQIKQLNSGIDTYFFFLQMEKWKFKFEYGQNHQV